MGKRRRKELEDRLERLERQLLYGYRRYSDESRVSSRRSKSPRRTRSPRSRRSRSLSSRRSRSPSIWRSRSPIKSPCPSQPVISIDEDPEQDLQKDPPTMDTSVPAEIEELLGSEGVPLPSNGIDLHDSLAKRWTVILQNGLDESNLDKIRKKYDSPKNCFLLTPPSLNEEVAATLSESSIKRDKRITDQQAILSAALSGLGRVLNNMISEGNSQNIETISDSARLLCHMFHNNSVVRRSLILPGLNKDVKDTLEKSPVTEFLFGDKFQDKINACRAMKKAAQELKNKTSASNPKTTTRTNSLNYRGPPRPQPPRPSGQKPKFMRPVQQARSYQRRKSPQIQKRPQHRRQDNRRR